MTPVPPSDILTLSTRHSASRQRNHLPATMFRGPTAAATMVEVAALITPDLLVEIEADAYVDSSAES
jgi:enamine deaminase RidA (YjgF/YER057c/UK114 family)